MSHLITLERLRANLVAFEADPLVRVTQHRDEILERLEHLSNHGIRTLRLPLTGQYAYLEHDPTALARLLPRGFNLEVDKEHADHCQCERVDCPRTAYLEVEFTTV